MNNYRREQDYAVGAEALERLVSPYLGTELLTQESWAEGPGLTARRSIESPFLYPNPTEPETEILDTDERALVADTLRIPNRWICAIDIFSENPQYGKPGQPQFISGSRATGILIGPRYVLTAGHIMGKRSIEVDGESRVVDVKFVTVSPARNGRNSGAGNPFGKVKSKAVMVDRGSDFALIILEKALAGTTHSRLKGALSFWGSNPAVAAIRQFEPAALQGKEIIVSGYPGDTCGKDRLAKADKARKMSLCLHRRPDEWASTQWASAGILEPVAHTPLLYHTADTYNGQSGAPLCLAADHRLYLIGIHTGPHNAQKNKGVRVTNLMLKKLCEWMNADAGYPIASVQNDTLQVQSPSSPRKGAQEHFDGPSPGSAFAGEGDELPEAGPDREADWERQTPAMGAFNPSLPDFTKTGYEADESELDFKQLSELDFKQLGEEHYVPASVPKDVAEALGKKEWARALSLAIQAGWRDENELTNLLFFTRHPELPIQPLEKQDPKFKQLSAEWAKTQNEEVWPAIRLAAENTDLVVAGSEVTDHHWSFFRGQSGKALKKLIADAAREVDINPGLLGAIMMAETRRPRSYFSNEKVSSYHIGADDFYEGRAAILARVPAYTKVKWDKTQVWQHLNDAQTKPRMVKTILFNSGRDAALATAVYLKFREVRLREVAAELKGDFDALPLATRFALTRMAMAAGTAGATPYLQEALKGKDIFIRKAIPVKAYQTKRNATVRTAQAMHLSDWIFGIPVPAPVAQPELEAFDGFYPPETEDPELIEGEPDQEVELAYPVESLEYTSPGQPDYEEEDDESDINIEDRELDPRLLAIVENTIAREATFFENQAPKRWTSCFSATDVAKVQKTYEDNTAAATTLSVDRCSCIVMLNVALGQLLPLTLKANPARGKSTRTVQMGALTTETIEKAMAQLEKQGFTGGAVRLNFFDRRNRTAGTLKPERLKASVQARVLADAKTEGCWFAFAMSIMDGYHSVLLLVDHTATTAKIYWLDQFSTGFNDEVTTSLDQRLTDYTLSAWQSVMDSTGTGFNTTIRLWKLRKPR